MAVRTALEAFPTRQYYTRQLYVGCIYVCFRGEVQLHDLAKGRGRSALSARCEKLREPSNRFKRLADSPLLTTAFVVSLAQSVTAGKAKPRDCQVMAMLNAQAHRAQTALTCLCSHGKLALRPQALRSSLPGRSAKAPSAIEGPQRRRASVAASGNGSTPPGGGLAINLTGIEGFRRSLLLP